MLTASFVLSTLVQLVLPILICFYLVRRYQSEWRLVGVGVVAYLLFWVMQPVIVQALEGNDFYVNQILTLPKVYVFLIEGLILSVLEQAIRTGSFWYARAKVKEWGKGLTVASGQAGFGLLLIGLQLLLFFISWSTLTTTRGEGMNLTPEELAGLSQQIADFWALPWIFPLLVGLQSLVILTLQFALGMMVWQAVNQKAWVWVGAAILWETALNTIFKVLAQSDPDVITTGVFVLTALVNAGLMYWLYRKTSEPAEAVAALK